jgi:isoleucyl-tRNA synthetase
MAAVQRIVRLAHAARNVHSIKVRQPLASVTLVTANPRLPELVTPYAEVLRDELNVQEIRWAEDRSAYVRHEIKPVFPKLGPRFGKRMKQVQQTLARADGDALAAELEAQGRITLELADGPEELAEDELEVRLIEKEETATQGDRELLVALDTHLTPELIAEGWAREVVNRIQTARKDDDLDYADRIRVRYRAASDLAAAVAAHRGWIAEQTLAVELEAADELPEGAREATVEGMEFAFALERV